MKKKSFVKIMATVMAVVSTVLTVNIACYAASPIATGIDVSKYNGNVGWGAVAGSGVKFAFIRVGNPQTGLDPQFAANMRNASAAGIKTGVYYYSHATTVEAATAEALQTLNWIKDYTVNYPVVYDVEASGQKKLSASQLQAIVNTYCSIIDAAGYYPVVYSYKSLIQTKLSGVPWDKWIAQYSGNLDNSGAAFWQYSNKGKVAGINGNVDMNYQYKNYDKLIVSDGFVPHNGGTRLYLGWKMQTGWVNIGGVRYYLDQLGFLQTGWFADTDGKLYYLTPGDGHAAVGVQAVDGVTYLFDINGVRCSGFTTLGDMTFYNDPLTGALMKGWFTLPDGSTYYADDNGVIARGVYILKDVIYYFDGKGALVRNGKLTVDGINFVTTEDGIVLPVE